MNLDILAFGAHPDDIELGCGGTLINQIKKGNSVGLIDLTRGELGSRGTAELRTVEAENARVIIGASVRENLGLADGFFQNNKESQLKVISILRKYRPKIIICNAIFDRHPDHGKASQLLEDCAFLSGLIKIETTDNGKFQEAFRPSVVLHYIQDRTMKPDFVVDVTDVWQQKIDSVLAHKSQFYDPTSSEPETYIASAGFISSVEDRAVEMGRSCNMKLAEGFLCKRVFGIENLFHII